MAFTDHCDVFGSFHEEGFNRIIRHVMLQRPSLFNYATADLVGPPPDKRVCHPFKVHPGVNQYSNPHMDTVPYLPIPGFNGPYGLSFSVQLSELELDFYPTNRFSLPAELGNKLPAQQLALRAKVCAGIACPDRQILDRLGDAEWERSREDKEQVPVPERPLPFERLQCFCLELFGVAGVERTATHLKLRLSGLEIRDIAPEGLENSMECYIETMLRLAVFPKLQIALNDLVFDLGGFVSIEPTPISAQVPFNPSVDNDQLSVFLNLS
jgi:hypothetical protein